MSDLFGNHIVGFPTRRLKCALKTGNLYIGRLIGYGVARTTDRPYRPLAVDHGVKVLLNQPIK